MKPNGYEIIKITFHGPKCSFIVKLFQWCDEKKLNVLQEIKETMMMHPKDYDEPFKKTYDGSGIPTVKEARLNVLPEVTDCEAESDPVTSNLELVVSMIA